MQFLQTHSLFLLGIMAAMLPLAQAQTSAAPAGNPKTSANAKLKLADEAFRAGSAAYLRNDLHSAHIQFAKVVQLAPGVAAGQLRYQACNDKACFPPKTVEINVPYSVQ